jgi:hypothetical protein
MKPLGTAIAALLFFVLGSTFAAYAQEQHEDGAAPPAHQEEARPPARPETEAPPPRQEAPKPEAPPHQQEARPAPVHPDERPEARPVPGGQPIPPPRPGEAPRPQQPPHPQPTPQQRSAAQAAWQSHRAQNWQTAHRTWQQRGGYHGYRIPEARYSAYFGPAHVFPIYTVPVTVVGGYPRFQYQGFWFTVVDPWPATWGDNWYYQDNVYIVYTDGGYYLVNPSYPGVELAVNVSM